MLGVVWPDGHTAFPDFLDKTNKTLAWWINEFKLYHEKVDRHNSVKCAKAIILGCKKH